MAITLYANGGYWIYDDLAHGEINGEEYTLWPQPYEGVDSGEVQYFIEAEPERSDYELIGWNTRYDGKGSNIDINSINSTPIDENISYNLYAQWQEIDYGDDEGNDGENEGSSWIIDVSFNPNNGNSIQNFSLDFINGNEIILPNYTPNETNQAEGFKGWQLLTLYENSTLYQPGDTVSSFNEGESFLAIWETIYIYADMGNGQSYKKIKYELSEELLEDEWYGSVYYQYLRENNDQIYPSSVPSGKYWLGEWQDESGNLISLYEPIKANNIAFKIYPILEDYTYYDITFNSYPLLDYQGYKESFLYSYPGEQIELYLGDYEPEFSEEKLGDFNIYKYNPETEETIVQKNFQYGKKQRYNFKGWSYEENGEIIEESYIWIDKSLTLYPNFEPTGDVYTEHKISELTAIDEENQTGWIFNNTFYELYSNENLIPDGTYIAEITPRYSISFQDQSGNLIDSKTIKQGDFFILPNVNFDSKFSDFYYYRYNPITEEKIYEIDPNGNYEIKVILDYWQNSFGLQYTPGSQINNVQNNMTFTAITKEQPIAHTLRKVSDLEPFYTNKDSENVQTETKTFMITYKYSIEDGYLVDENDNLIEGNSQVGKINVYCYQDGWKENGIELNSDNIIEYGKTYSAIVYDNVSEVIEPITILNFKITNLEKDFIGWGKTENIQDSNYTPNTQYNGPNNLTLYAIFKSYSVPVFIKGENETWYPALMRIKDNNNQWI